MHNEFWIEAVALSHFKADHLKMPPKIKHNFGFLARKEITIFQKKVPLSPSPFRSSSQLSVPYVNEGFNMIIKIAPHTTWDEAVVVAAKIMHFNSCSVEASQFYNHSAVSSLYD